MRIQIIILLFIPILGYGQLKVEGIYPTHQYFSGEISLLLSNQETDPISGYTSFQLISEFGDTITHETGPDYFLPAKNSSSTYRLKLMDEFQNVPDNLCGKLVLKNPELELDFCLGNVMGNGNIGEIDCDDHEIVKMVYAGEYWNHEISILLSSTDFDGAGITGYSSFQLFNSLGDSITAKTGPNYFLPILNTDTIVYNLKLLEDIFDDPINLDSSCFELHVFNPECILSFCNLISTVKETNQNQINLYPNPFTSIINIDNNTFDKVDIFNLNGTLVYSQKGNLQTISDFNPQSGIYLILLYKDDTVTTKRIVKM